MSKKELIHDELPRLEFTFEFQDKYAVRGQTFYTIHQHDSHDPAPKPNDVIVLDGERMTIDKIEQGHVMSGRYRLYTVVFK